MSVLTGKVFKNNQLYTISTEGFGYPYGHLAIKRHKDAKGMDRPKSGSQSAL